jgi:pyruvate kinase
VSADGTGAIQCAPALKACSHRFPERCTHQQGVATKRKVFIDETRNDKIRLTAIEVSPQRALTRVEVGGKLSARKGVSLPDTVVGFSALTGKDHSDLEAALDAGADWIALSFIQRPDDIADAKKIARGRAAVMAKMEKPQAIEHLDGILDITDALMVARGDLGVELPVEKFPACRSR